jgi:hypothetical protein
MTDEDDLAYFTGVLKRLDALSNRVTDDSVLPVMATEAKLYVGALVGCLIPECEDASTVGRGEPVRVAGVKDDDAAFAANAEAIRRGHDAKIQATKSEIDQWAKANERPGNGGTITLALLELGIERHLELFPDEKSATDLVEGVLRKVLRRRRGPLQ